MRSQLNRTIAATISLAAAAVLIVWAAPTSLLAEDGEGSNTDSTGFAVIELFTSEGCSSCPPADRLLSHIDTLAERTGAPVYALSFHVDYWNQLGWADPYSSAAYTSRQRAYAAAAGDRSVYTPQMIVNGEERFVGSDGKRAQAALNNVLATPSDVGLQVEAEADEGEVVVAYRAISVPEGAVVNVALVQAEGSQAVPRGENTGRTLRHVNIVRAFHTEALGSTGAGTVRLDVPPGVNGETRVIVYLQDQETKRVVSAASTTVS